MSIIKDEETINAILGFDPYKVADGDDSVDLSGLNLTSCDFVGDSGCTEPTCQQCHGPPETRLFTQAMVERATKPNESPVVAVVAVHEDGSYTLLDMIDPKPVSRVILYVDERNEFGKQAVEWFKDINHVTIPMDRGLPFATQGAATYRWRNDELKQFARSLKPLRIFKRVDEDPASGIDYEMCSGCGKHIRHHYSTDEKLPKYRCDPAY